MKTGRFISSLLALPVPIILALVSITAPAIAGESHKPVIPTAVMVQYRLAEANILSGNNVKVNVRGRDVILTGTVNTIYDRHQASKLARKTASNYTIVNDLKLAPPTSPDSLIDVEVMRRIERDTRYTVFDWAVAHSKKGIVTLSGWVRNPFDVVEYQRQAERVVGVRKVVNNLGVEMGYRRLAWRAVRIVYRQGMLLGYSLKLDPPVHVIAVDGVVLLEGKIDSRGLGSYLASVVGFRTDAIRVINNLQGPA